MMVMASVILSPAAERDGEWRSAASRCHLELVGDFHLIFLSPSLFITTTSDTPRATEHHCPEPPSTLLHDGHRMKVCSDLPLVNPLFFESTHRIPVQPTHHQTSAFTNDISPPAPVGTMENTNLRLPASRCMTPSPPESTGPFTPPFNASGDEADSAPVATASDAMEVDDKQHRFARGVILLDEDRKPVVMPMTPQFFGPIAHPNHPNYQPPTRFQRMSLAQGRRPSVVLKLTDEEKEAWRRDIQLANET